MANAQDTRTESKRSNRETRNNASLKQSKYGLLTDYSDECSQAGENWNCRKLDATCKNEVNFRFRLNFKENFRKLHASNTIKMGSNLIEGNVFTCPGHQYSEGGH
ncbi:hypothetical protein AVEN_184799-1 [Araneus ventricosus]|uniref:Uncharacterized protein n=1 Tax=Araneus ventricosus TaxID=182803 RepID=A0A4Y2JDD4_ARAVE|nr:hypothetical protein AVEN_184799-1 [Araneus ventricosus]